MKKCSCRENLLKGVASVIGSLIKGKSDRDEAGVGGGGQDHCRAYRS